jgi:hypothetical protein
MESVDRRSSVVQAIGRIYSETKFGKLLDRFLAILPLIATAIIVAIVFLAETDQWSLPKAKLALLAAEYFVFLPSLLVVLFRSRNREQKDASPLQFRLGRRWQIGPIVVFVIVLFPLALVLRRGFYQGDENAYLFQARCLSAGRLYMQQPSGVPTAAISYDHHVLLNGKWFAKYPIGWPLVLSVGTLLSAEWLVNPLLSVALLWVTAQLSNRLFRNSTAAVCAVFTLALSAFFVLNSLGFMSHVLCALCLASAFLCYTVFSESKNSVWMVCTFALLGAAALARPFDTVCAGVAFIVAMDLRWKLSAFASVLWRTLTLVAIVLSSLAIQNRLLTGTYLTSPYVVNRSGPMPKISLDPTSLVESALHIAPVRLADTCSVAFPFAFLLALYGLWKHRKERAAWALLVIFASLVVGYLVELDDSDSPIGERYYFCGFFALAILAGLGLTEIVKDFRLNSQSRRNMAAYLSVAGLATVGLCAYWNWNLRWPSRQLADAAGHPPFTRGVVFVGGTDSVPAWRLNFNSPGSKVLFLSDPGPAGRAQLAQIAGKPEWVCLYYNPRAKSAEWGKVVETVP